MVVVLRELNLLPEGRPNASVVLNHDGIYVAVV